MDLRQLPPRVARLFRRGSSRTTRVGVEHELLSVAPSGAAAPVAVVRAAAAGSSYAEHLGFEPGGQVELSLPCAASPQAVAARLQRTVDELRRDCGRVGVRLDAMPADPRLEAEVPLQLTTPRYLAMQRHFDSVGPAGRRMMRRTASTQVCLDWWPGAAGLEQWRVLNLAAPFLAAAFNRTAGPRGRLATWLEVDPARTAFDDRLLRGDPVGAYADFAAGATPIVADLDQHLTTLFPPVRPRGRYLELRFLDVQPVDAVEHVVTVLARLAYDDEHRRRWLGRLTAEEPRLAEHWRAAADGEASVGALGLAIAGPRVAGVVA